MWLRALVHDDNTHHTLMLTFATLHSSLSFFDHGMVGVYVQSVRFPRYDCGVIMLRSWVFCLGCAFPIIFQDEWRPAYRTTTKGGDNIVFSPPSFFDHGRLAFIFYYWVLKLVWLWGRTNFMILFCLFVWDTHIWNIISRWVKIGLWRQRLILMLALSDLYYIKQHSNNLLLLMDEIVNLQVLKGNSSMLPKLKLGKRAVLLAISQRTDDSIKHSNGNGLLRWCWAKWTPKRT
jgi:hypothetical protein